MNRAEWREVREPDLAELRGAGWSQWIGHMYESPMTVGHVLIAFVLIVIGLTIAYRLDSALVAFLAILAGWWAGRLLQPKRM